MSLSFRHILLAPVALAGLSACTAQTGGEVARGEVAFDPIYEGVETRLLEGDLVNFRVAMSGARDAEDVHDYAECAAAQYALIRGFGFARHVRTTTDNQGGLWSGDAVYTISPALPRGLKTIDAEVVVADCEDNGIPTV
ncbi:hypothetical protein [Shimia marina]|uniref:Lipoprotein n=1 Tax=Shimia marina TaxID=321267 RepID=A0A0P1EKE3_9RHOB|nr:hypothetical protein [Shimia marina]CUH50655.1 hypothetical protein SHM7688_00082 [Shimia marina]SFE37623.1 hypothetical protein SAMN04488037_108113 [Shimia marina]